MRKLVRITLATAVQFTQPLGVQKIVTAQTGPKINAKLFEHPNGDVSVWVHGSIRPNFEHVIHRESIVEKGYENDGAEDALPLSLAEAHAPLMADPDVQKTAQEIATKVDRRTKEWRDANKASSS